MGFWFLLRIRTSFKNKLHHTRARIRRSRQRGRRFDVGRQRFDASGLAAEVEILEERVEARSFVEEQAMQHVADEAVQHVEDEAVQHVEDEAVQHVEDEAVQHVEDEAVANDELPVADAEQPGGQRFDVSGLAAEVEILEDRVEPRSFVEEQAMQHVEDEAVTDDELPVAYAAQSRLSVYDVNLILASCSTKTLKRWFRISKDEHVYKLLKVKRLLEFIMWILKRIRSYFRKSDTFVFEIENRYKSRPRLDFHSMHIKAKDSFGSTFTDWPVHKLDETILKLEEAVQSQYPPERIINMVYRDLPVENVLPMDSEPNHSPLSLLQLTAKRAAEELECMSDTELAAFIKPLRKF